MEQQDADLPRVAADEYTRKLYRVRRTCLQMLLDRGYVVPPDELAFTLEDFVDKFCLSPTERPQRINLMILSSRQEDPADKVIVFFPDDEKLTVGTIKDVWTRMGEESARRAILVLAGTMTPMAKTALAELKDTRIEVFQETEIVVNITEHMLVPKHRILTTEEKKILMDRYNVKDTQLPRIQFNDPIARYFGMQRGQVVRIVRPSETAGRYVSYRLCI